MVLHERILQPLDRKQRMFFILFFGGTLLGNLGMEFFATPGYKIRLIHLGLVFGLIQAIVNPKSIRFLFFSFFIFLIMKLFQNQNSSYSPYMMSGYTDQYLFSFILVLLPFSFKLIFYTHLIAFSFLAFFSLKNPFKPKEKVNSEVIDDFQKDH